MCEGGGPEDPAGSKGTLIPDEPRDRHHRSIWLGFVKKKKDDITISPEQRAEIAKWVKEHASELPDGVRIVLEQSEHLFSALEGSSYQVSKILMQWRRAMGIIPSSERRKSGDPIGPNKQADGLKPEGVQGNKETPSERSHRLSNWHRNLSRRHKRKAKKLKKKEDQMTKVEDIELDADDVAELEKEQQEFLERLKLGEKVDPALESATQTLMAGAEVSVQESMELLSVPDEETAGVKVLDTLVETRERYDCALTVSRVEIQVEKKIVEDASGERRVISPSTLHLGPPRYAVTWDFLVNSILMIVQYAMPMHRLARLLSSDSKKFTAGYLARLLQYVARRFAPIYLVLVDALADSPVWVGDDTSVRVLEVQDANKSPPDAPKPWASYGTTEKAVETYNREEDESEKHSLGVILGRELGFEFPRRGPQGGTKTTLHTTVLSGRSNADDPRSLIVLYRSHLGSLGNLLEILLEKRSPKRKQVVIQSDLSTANLVVAAELCTKFDITYAGCASHARRPFALHEQEDPDYCAAMLHYFKGLFIYELCLDTDGRNRERVLAVRGVDGLKMWETIKDLAETMKEKWSQKTKLGDAANYILKNYDKLTTYLKDPRLELSNNFSERMLRMEKIIESSSLFRKTLEGRFSLDIMRSVLQTAVAAGAPLQEYLHFVLRTDPKEVAAHPEKFTPLAYSKMKAKQQETDPTT